MWIPFIPLFVGGVLLRVYQALFDPKGVDVGVTGGGAITAGFAAIIIAMFLIVLVMSALDRRTSAIYQVKKNLSAGAFAIIAGALLFADAVTSFTQGITIYVVIDGIMTLVGGLAIIVMGISSLSGNNKAHSLPGLMIMAPLWGFARTFIMFLNDTTISTESRDMTDIVIMVFATLFLFNCAMIYTNIKGKHAVKNSFLYGMPLVILSVAYAVSHTIWDLRLGVYSFIGSVKAYEYLAIGLFALFLLVEMSRGAVERSKEEYEDAGIDPSKMNVEPVLIHTEIDPDSVIYLSDDPIMLKAQETLENIDESFITEHDLSRYKEGLEDADQDSEPVDLNVRPDDEDSDDENFFGEFVEDDQAEELVEEQQEAYDEDVLPDTLPEEDITEGESADAQQDDDFDVDNSDDVDIDDIDLDSINRLIMELTGEGEE